MTEQEVRELAAILVQEHGETALRIAQARRDQHGRCRHSQGFQLWSRIAAAVAELLAYVATTSSRRAAD